VNNEALNDEIPPMLWRTLELREELLDDSFRLWWLGQSGFALRYRGDMAVLDPYLSDSLTKKYEGTNKPHVRLKPILLEPIWLAQALPTVITASHQHTDHLDSETLQPMVRLLEAWDRQLPLVAPEAWRKLACERSGLPDSLVLGLDEGQAVRAGVFEFRAVPAAHDQLERDEAGRYKYLGFVVRFGNWTIYHSGDSIAFEGMVERLRREGPIDIAILPINGKVGNMSGRDAARLAKDIGARLVVPCHYDMFEFNTADPKDEFIPECERLGQPYRVLKLGERFSSDELPAR